VHGRDRLRAGDHILEVASAQLKSAILLAALRADGPTTVVEPGPSRDHTERLLRACGVGLEVDGPRITLAPGPLEPIGLRVPGDLSSAAFLLAIAAARPGSRLSCPGVTLNPGRTGFLEVLEAMGARVEIVEAEPAAGVEPVGAVSVEGAALRATVVAGDLVPRCIDELPVIAVLATQAEGTTRIADAAELRVKESDRIAAIATGLRRLGAAVEELPDGLAVTGPTALRPTVLDSGGDHRLAMAWAVAASLVPPSGGDSIITGAQACAVSYPGFFAELTRLAAGA
jgi:3-phosphoshikimate 1-carboxyvinyltransferase